FNYDFKNRFSGEPDYYSAKGEQVGFLLQTNFVADAINLPLITAKERGAGGGHIRFNMAKGSIASHISQFPVGTYKKAHAHGPGAHVIVLTGEGYSLMWPEGEEPKRYDWKYGTLIVPPNAWFHQHFNSGPVPARYLAFKHSSPRNSQGVPLSCISRRLGCNQIDYAEELTHRRRSCTGQTVQTLQLHSHTPNGKTACHCIAEGRRRQTASAGLPSCCSA